MASRGSNLPRPGPTRRGVSGRACERGCTTGAATARPILGTIGLLTSRMMYTVQCVQLEGCPRRTGQTNRRDAMPTGVSCCNLHKLEGGGCSFKKTQRTLLLRSTRRRGESASEAGAISAIAASRATSFFFFFSFFLFLIFEREKLVHKSSLAALLTSRQ